MNVKVTKIGAGYVFIKGAEYRCRDCWKLCQNKTRCAEMRTWDPVKPNGYCILWAHGTPRSDLIPTGAYTPEELGYGEEPNGTKCYKCQYFDQKWRKSCERVDEKSRGDTPGLIHPHACCGNQEPLK